MEKQLLEVRNLVKKYGNKTAVDGLDFCIQSGEIVGLLGLNGAGKSTTMNCITGYIAPTEGSITVDGFDLLKEPDKAKRVIGYLPEVFSYYSDMKVWEYLNFVCDLKGFSRNRQIRRDHIGTVCEKVGIRELTGRMIRNLSKGYKQRVGFAQALIGNPKVLILDEPTVGLDPSQIIEIRQLIKDSGRESTVIVSSHILSEIQALCTRIIVIHDGHIAWDGATSMLLEEDQQRELTIRVKGNAGQAEAVLQKIPGIYRYRKLSEDPDSCVFHLLQEGGQDVREAVFFAFSEAGLALLEMHGRELSLEHTFLHLTGQDGNRPGAQEAEGGVK